jgi:serine/threonine protein phosphatase 1
MIGKSFFIADVHGQDHLLESVLGRIEEMSVGDAVSPRVVFLGDLIDRGMGTKDVLEAVCKTIGKWPRSVSILGNHDHLLLEIIDGTSSRKKTDFWYGHAGGFDTCASYDPEGELKPFIRTIRKDFPHHVELLRNASLMERDGAFVACHAGINGYLPLDQQDPHDLMWISDGFLDRVDEQMPPVIHGHSVMGDLPVVTENRISLDTGAYESGRLTFLCIDRDQRKIEFLQTSGDGSVSTVEPLVHDRGRGSLLDRMDDLLQAD